MAITIQKIIGSSEGNPDSGLTARNKINSNFQNLVDAILSIQVEAGTTSFNNLTDKPTTLSGYGIADSYDKTQVDTLLSGKMSSSIFNDLFEKVNIGTELAPVYAIKAKYDFYGIGEVSAYGIGIGGSGGSGLIQTVYGYTNLGGTYSDSTLTDTFNAYTINQLASRITTLEGGTSSNISISTIGTGNAVTSLTKSGTVITVNLGNSFSLSGHTHTFNALTDKPTTLSGYGIVDAVDITTYGNHVISNLHLTDAQRNVLALLSVVDGKLKSTADFYSEGEVSAYGVGNGGSGGSGLIVYGYNNLGGIFLDSDYIDTFNAYTINQLASRITTLEGGTSSNISISTIGTGNAITTATKSGDVITFAKDSTFVLTNDYRLSNARYNPYALTFSGYSTLSYDGSTAVTIPIPNNTSQLTNGAGYITASGSITGNAGTATALKNSRTIWGQSFNGSANVTGALSSVTDVAMSGTLSIGSAQFVYDSINNTIRVQKSDGSAIGFYSTGEVASYGVGATGGNSYINAALNILTTNDDAAGINLLKITNNGSDVLKYTRKYNGWDTYDLIMGSWSSIQASNRLDFHANQIFFNAGSINFQGALTNTRVGDASSTSTQKNSYPLVFQNSLWNGSSAEFSHSAIRTIASTTINKSYKLSFLIGTDSIGNGGTEILEINSTGIKITGTITSTGSGTFNGGSFSSLRSLKTIHKDWQGNALDEIAKFQIRDFNYNNQLDCNRTLGFIVDEIPESMSEYVLANKDKNAINLYTLHALAFLGLQETKSEVDKLKEKIISLKNEIDYLKIKLN